MNVTIKKSLIVQNKRTRKSSCEFADIIDVSFLIIINHINWVLTGCRLGANLVLS